MWLIGGATVDRENRKYYKFPQLHGISVEFLMLKCAESSLP